MLLQLLVYIYTCAGGTPPDKLSRSGRAVSALRILGVKPFKTPSRRILFFIVFSMPFWIDFWLILLPNLAPQIYQNRSKIDGKMHSILGSIFGSFFGRSLFPTSTHWISKNIVFPLEKQGFLKNGLSKLTSIYDPILLPTWLDFGTKIHHNPPKDRFQEASKK